MNLRRRAIMASKKARLPKEYQEVEYLESTGKQWINTGVKNFSTIKVSSVAEALYNAAESLFGARRTAGAEDIRFLFSAQRFISVGLWDTYWGYNEMISSSGYLGKHKFEIDAGRFYFDGNLVHSNLQTHKISSGYNFYLFAFNNGGGAASFGYWKIYSLGIYDGDFTLRNFVPCYRKSDHKPGLYDLAGSICPLTGTPFYINANTSATTDFIVGADVN